MEIDSIEGTLRTHLESIKDLYKLGKRSKEQVEEIKHGLDFIAGTRVQVELSGKVLANTDLTAVLANVSVLAEQLKARRKVCTACMEFWPEDESLQLACDADHMYCKPCLKGLFKASLTDFTQGPASCCGRAIPLDKDVRRLIGSPLWRKAERKSFELDNPLYCSNRSCAKVLRPGDITKRWSKNYAWCRYCSEQTCPECRAPRHVGYCKKVEDHATRQLLDLAKERKWRQCYKCKRMVERSRGCPHMTCVCTAQFCYTCGAAWQTCRCHMPAVPIVPPERDVDARPRLLVVRRPLRLPEMPVNRRPATDAAATTTTAQTTTVPAPPRPTLEQRLAAIREGNRRRNGEFWARRAEQARVRARQTP